MMSKIARRVACLGVVVVVGCGPSGDLPTVPPIPADHIKETPKPVGVLPKPAGGLRKTATASGES